MRSDLIAFAAASAFLALRSTSKPRRSLGVHSRIIERASTASRAGRPTTLMLATFAIICALSAYVEYIRTSDVRWLIGGTIIIASWPCAYFVMIR
jgi:hypothetical protein